MSRMTWIKPSFRWMMYRCGYAAKPGQEVVLAIDISRSGFEWALEHAVLSSFHEPVHGDERRWKRALASAPVRVQWDPERDIRLAIMDGVRSIQIGLRDEAVERYVDDWIVRITDVTILAKEIGADPAAACTLNTPDRQEKLYPVTDPGIRSRLRMDEAGDAAH